MCTLSCVLNNIFTIHELKYSTWSIAFLECQFIDCLYTGMPFGFTPLGSFDDFNTQFGI